MRIYIYLIYIFRTLNSVQVYKTAHGSEILSVCIELDTSNKPYYIRGTINNSSYAEGKIVDVKADAEGSPLSIQALLSNVGIEFGEKTITTASGSSLLNLNKTSASLYYW